MLTAAAFKADVIVPVLALVFTVASFWWIWLRRGRLRVSPPRAFASVTTQALVRIRFALVIHNTGAAPIVIDDLRMRIDGHDLRWISTRRTLRPDENDREDWAKPIAVAGRVAREVIVEFGESDLHWIPEPGQSYPAVIERLTRGKWRSVVEFVWWAPTASSGAYLGRLNRPPTSA
ncbi:MAG: hypothetical protein KDB21_07550 [Acidimicrobiales bacterium]|nr:hypothetical protein [Acidimicrobiales bacterium]